MQNEYEGFLTKLLLIVVIALTATTTTFGCGASAKPGIQEVDNFAKGILQKSEDNQYFTINTLGSSTISQIGDNVFEVKIGYCVRANTDVNLVSSSGDKHVLPLGQIEEGYFYNGVFTMGLKNIDNRLDIQNYNSLGNYGGGVSGANGEADCALNALNQGW